MLNFRKAFLQIAWLALGAVCAGSARAGAPEAEFAPHIWINPGFYSAHFDQSKNLRNDNWGFGVEVLLTNDHGLVAGSYANSNWARTHYFGYEWRPLHWQLAGLNVSAGIIVGAFDGYPNYKNGGWFVAPIPVLEIEHDRLGFNVGIVPTISNRVDGAIVFQVKLRVW